MTSQLRVPTQSQRHPRHYLYIHLLTVSTTATYYTHPIQSPGARLVYFAGSFGLRLRPTTCGRLIIIIQLCDLCLFEPSRQGRSCTLRPIRRGTDLHLQGHLEQGKGDFSVRSCGFLMVDSASPFLLILGGPELWPRPTRGTSGYFPTYCGIIISRATSSSPGPASTPFPCGHHLLLRHSHFGQELFIHRRLDARLSHCFFWQWDGDRLRLDPLWSASLSAMLLSPCLRS